MRLALMIEPQQGLSFDEQVAVARHVEDAGLEALFRSDHYESFPGETGEPTTDAWAVLAGLARETTRIGLGVLVSPVMYRLPGNLAKLAITVDEMSGGRVEVGVGAGWHAEEHRRHGFPFPEISERADRLEETLEILHGLWEGPDGWSFLGRYYAVEDALFRPKPGSVPGRDGGRPKLIVGGQGTPRSFRIAARWADEFNLSSSSPQVARQKYAALDEVVRAAGREPESVTHSSMVGVLIGRDRDEVRRREADLLRAFGDEGDAEAWFGPRRARWIHGTPEEARAKVREFAEAGVERIMLQDFIARDLDMIDLAGELLFGA
jgi:F420-dependent oxidoreductase-like protein